MPNLVYNIIILAVCWVLATGAGVYVTYVQQPEEMERLEKAEKVARLKQAELQELLAEEATSKERAEEALRKWRARYKKIPQQLPSAEVIAYMNEQTETGFENFDVIYQGERPARDVRFHQYDISGRGYFSDLYRFVWETENNRQMYRIEDLNLDHMDLVKTDEETDREMLQVMVSFRLKLYAYFGGSEQLSAPDRGPSRSGENVALPGAQLSDLPPVPLEVLPQRRPSLNPFQPLISETLPPNTYNLVDAEEATLVSIVAGEGIFEWDGNLHALGAGDKVYLGEVVSVDATAGKVLIRLNKGGIIDEVEHELETGDRFRQAQGGAQLAPINRN